MRLRVPERNGTCGLVPLLASRRGLGVGRRLAAQLAERGIRTVEALRQADPATLRRSFSVVLERTRAELNGVSCLTLEDVSPPRQQIQSSRSFGQYVHDLPWLEEAVASYVSMAAEKLRRQHSLAGMLQVYLRTNPHRTDAPQYQQGLTVPLPTPTDDTLRLITVARWALKKIYRPGYAYQKAGVVLMNLCDAGTAQGDLFSNRQDNPRLMQAMDRINATWGRGTLRSAEKASTRNGR